MNPTLFAIQNTFGSVFVALLNTLIPACLLAIAIWTLFRLFPNLSAAIRYGTWWAVLIAVVAMPFTPRVFNLPNRFISAPGALPAITLTELPTSLPSEIKPENIKPHALVGTSKSPAAPALTFLTRESLRAASIIPVPPKPSLLDKLRSARATLPIGNWVLWIGVIWLTAALWRLARIARSYVYLRRVLAHSAAAPPEQAHARLAFWTSVRKLRTSAKLLTSSETTGPMAFGIFQPTVVLPTSLLRDINDEELDHVLLHELAHLARRDNWTNLLARMVGVIAGLHPIAAYALHQIEYNRELACDDWVVSTTGEPHSYAAALARVFELCHPSMSATAELATGMADHPSPSHLGTRIAYLLKQGRSFRTRVPAKVWAIQAVTLAALVLLGAECPRWIAMAQAPDKLGFPAPNPISKYFIPYTKAKPGDIVIFRHPTDIAQNFVPSEARPSTSAANLVASSQTQTLDQLLSETNLIIDQVNHDLASWDTSRMAGLKNLLREAEGNLKRIGGAPLNDQVAYIDNLMERINQKMAGEPVGPLSMHHTSGSTSGTSSSSRLVSGILSRRFGPPPNTKLNDLNASLARMRELRSRYAADDPAVKDLELQIHALETEVARVQPVLVLAPIPKSVELSVAENDFMRIRRDLDILLQKDKESHPDVVRTRKLLEVASARRDALAQEYESSRSAFPSAREQAQAVATLEEMGRRLFGAETKLLRMQGIFTQILQERQDLLAHYKPEHPSVKRVEEKITSLRLEMAANEEQVRQLASEMRKVNLQPQAGTSIVLARASEFLAEQLDVEQKKVGPPNTDRIIDLQKQLLAAREAEIAAWMGYAAQMRAQTGGPPNP